MQVFKAYFKILRSTMAGMMIYLAVFLALAVVMSQPSANLTNDFMPTSMPISVINRDGDSHLVQGLIDYLAVTNELIENEDDSEQLQDTLFFRTVGYVAIIPPGFTQDLLAGEAPRIQKLIVPNSASSHYIDMQINKYLNTAMLYRQYGGRGSLEEIVAAVKSDLALAAPVKVADFGGTGNKAAGFAYFYGYFAYFALAFIMLGLSTTMLAFNRQLLRQRTACSPLSKRSMNLQLAAGHTLFSVCTWAFLVLFSVFIYGVELLDTGLFGLYSLNAFVFVLVCSSMGLLIGSIIKDYSMQAGAVNAITLGMSFLGGVFVPQALLHTKVLAVAKFLPTFWYIKAHDAITSLTNLPGANMRTIVTAMLIQLGFATAIFSLTLFFSKERRASAN